MALSASSTDSASCARFDLVSCTSSKGLSSCVGGARPPHGRAVEGVGAGAARARGGATLLSSSSALKARLKTVRRSTGRRRTLWQRGAWRRRGAARRTTGGNEWLDKEFFKKLDEVSGVFKKIR